MPSRRILARKKEDIRNMVEKYRDAKTIIMADYLGLTVAQDTEFRAGLREKGVDYKVLKNRMLLLTFRELGIDGIEDLLKGPTALAMSRTEYVATAKACVEAEKKYKSFELKGGIIDGKVVSIEDIRAIADLPTKEVLAARVLSGLNAPISGFVSVMAANLRGLLYVLKAVSERSE